MKIDNKAFTLIELLAVIVILAIIALIATPIVLSIINESKESAQLRSAEMYLKGVETSVASATIHNKKVKDGSYPIMPEGDVCLGTLQVSNETTTCNGEVLEIKMNGEVPSSGSVTIQNGKIKDIELKYSNDKTIVKDTTGNLKYQKTFKDICTYVSGTEKTAGAMYTCEVKKGTSYNFYVLTTPEEGAETINLIMDANINSSGEAVIPGETEDTGLVAWQSSGANADGPVTAMQFLYNATKDWTNITPVNYTYNDRTVQGNADGEGYTSFVSTNGVATITPLTGDGVTIGSEAEPLRARMPIYASDTSITEVTRKTNASYLYDNLDPDGINAPYGYWTLSSRADYSSFVAWLVFSYGSVNSDFDVYDASTIGVRPVINLKI